MPRLVSNLSLFLAAVAVGSSSAFVQNSAKTTNSNAIANTNGGPMCQKSNQLARSDDPFVLFSDFESNIPYGEESRKFRRTVYTHEDWVKHRSPDRFFKNIRSTTKSGIYKVRRIVLLVLVLCIGVGVVYWCVFVIEFDLI